MKFFFAAIEFNLNGDADLIQRPGTSGKILQVRGILRKEKEIVNLKSPAGLILSFQMDCPPSLLRFSFLGNSELVARKSRLWRDCPQKASAGKVFYPEIPPCFRRMRRAHRAPSRAPLQGTNSVLGKRPACPPCTMLGTGPARLRKGGAPHGFCAQRPCFRAGQGLKFNPSWAYLSKSEGGGNSKWELHFYAFRDK